MKIQTVRGIERDSATQNITAIKKGKTRSQFHTRVQHFSPN